MTERLILACGCVLGWERCFHCRSGLDLDQEKALAITMSHAEAVAFLKQDNVMQPAVADGEFITEPKK